MLWSSGVYLKPFVYVCLRERLPTTDQVYPHTTTPSHGQNLRRHSGAAKQRIHTVYDSLGGGNAATFFRKNDEFFRFFLSFLLLVGTHQPTERGSGGAAVGRGVPQCVGGWDPPTIKSTPNPKTPAHKSQRLPYGIHKACKNRKQDRRNNSMQMSFTLFPHKRENKTRKQNKRKEKKPMPFYWRLHSSRILGQPHKNATRNATTATF